MDLLTHCRNHEKECIKFVDLVSEAASREGGIEILCDFNNVVNPLTENLNKSLSLLSRNYYLEIIGGEYVSICEFFVKLFRDLESLKIKLVMYVDGSSGTSLYQWEQKFDTWKENHYKKIATMHRWLDYLDDRRELGDRCEPIRSVLRDVQVLRALTECGCEVVHCISHEADYVIASDLQSRPKAYAIFSNDTDFCIFNECKFIPFEFFDREKDLGLGEKERLTRKPLKLKVGLVSSNKVWKTLGLKNQYEMIEFSIISGNDFTKPHMNSLKERLGVGRYPLEVVPLVKKCVIVENNPIIKHEMDIKPRFKDAVHHSRKFYGLTLPPETLIDNEYTACIMKGIEAGQFPSVILAIYNGLFWHRFLLEAVGNDIPVVEMALAPLRAFVYRMVLDPKKNTVTEYGRTQDSSFDEVKVSAAQVNIPPLIMIKADKEDANMNVFFKIMSHQEPRTRIEWHRIYGLHDGLKCCLLRYFLLLNFNQNLTISYQEMLPLVAVVFNQVDVAFYQGLCLRPSIRCVTIANWFQDVYHHAYKLVGSVLSVSSRPAFPHPHEIFCGSVWTAFFMCSLRNDVYKRLADCIGQENFDKVEKEQNDIVQKQRTMIEHIFEGYFDLTPT